MTLTEFAFSSATAHTLGAVLGLGVGFVMVIRETVDCEGYDLLSVARGREGHLPAGPGVEQQAEEERSTCLIAEQIRDARPQVTVFLKQGNVNAAIRLFERLRELDPNIDWEQDELHTLIVQLLRSGQSERAIPHLEAYLRRFADAADGMRLQFAQVVLLRQQRPAKALRLLECVSRAGLPPRKRDLFDRVVRRAKQMQAEGIVELSEE